MQDDYKVRPNLTLTLGLRWERFGSISEKNDNLSSVVLGSGANALTDMSLRLGGTLYEVNKTDFGPQVGAHVESDAGSTTRWCCAAASASATTASTRRSR